MGKRVGIIGAGPGGLAAAVLAQAKGFQVHLYEAEDRVGGRNAALNLGQFKFDTGPTFFLMPQILEEIFTAAGKNLSDYVQLKRLDPAYRLDFGDGTFLDISSNPEKMAAEISKFSKKDADNFFKFREHQEKKFASFLPILRESFGDWSNLFRVKNIAALPYLNTLSVYDELSKTFDDERVRLAFTFQSKYLGMSPFECPSLFTILAHIEHHLGVWHPIGGCSAISEVLAKLFQELGGQIYLNSPVARCEIKSKSIKHVELKSGDQKSFDHYVMNADFAYGMESLFDEKDRKKYNNKKLEGLKYSCSTFMLYLGLKKPVSLGHHTIFFSKNYRKNIREISETLELSSDPSFYIQNPSVTDSTLAPAGKAGLYVLVPVPNLDAKIDWDLEKNRFRKLILNNIKARTGIDLEPLIEEEKMITPLDWKNERRIYKGATFSLRHSWDQMLQLRPHNQFEEFDNLFLVGGGTHPGSGLPTIFESARIASVLMDRRAKSLERKFLPEFFSKPKLEEIAI